MNETSYKTKKKELACSAGEATAAAADGHVGRAVADRPPDAAVAATLHVNVLAAWPHELPNGAAVGWHGQHVLLAAHGLGSAGVRRHLCHPVATHRAFQHKPAAGAGEWPLQLPAGQPAISVLAVPAVRPQQQQRGQHRLLSAVALHAAAATAHGPGIRPQPLQLVPVQTSGQLIYNWMQRVNFNRSNSIGNKFNINEILHIRLN